MQILGAYMKLLIIIVLSFSINTSSFARNLSCSIFTGEYCEEGKNDYPNGVEYGVGFFLGVTKFKILCEDGYMITADALAGVVVGPSFHRQSLRLSCPLSSYDLTGTYFGLKSNLGTGFDLSLGTLASKRNFCLLSGAGWGVGANFVGGKMKITRDRSRIEDYKYCSKKQKIIKQWSYKKCISIVNQDSLESTYSNDKLIRGPVRLFENSCPEPLGYYPVKSTDEEIRRNFDEKKVLIPNLF